MLLSFEAGKNRGFCRAAASAAAGFFRFKGLFELRFVLKNSSLALSVSSLALKNSSPSLKNSRHHLKKTRLSLCISRFIL